MVVENPDEAGSDRRKSTQLLLEGGVDYVEGDGGLDLMRADLEIK